MLLWLLVAVGLIGPAGAADRPAQPFSWLNPTTWPVVPVPNISVDPTNGVTLGLIPTLLGHDRGRRIVRIIAPDIVYNADFGWGGHVCILEFPSRDTQWSVVAGVMQRVESKFEAQYETGLTRTRRWSQSEQLLYDRSGTARFFGIGNATPYSAQSVYTNQRLRLRTQLGWNLTRAWQVAAILILRAVAPLDA